MWANGKWTKYATPGAMRIGNAMRVTSTGLKEFNRIANSTAQIQLELSPKLVKPDPATLTRGQLDPGWSRDYSDGHSELIDGIITIFEGSIKKAAQEFFQTSSINDEVLLWINNEIGAVGAHEANHSSNDNITKHLQNQKLKTNHNLEIEPDIIKQRFWDERTMQMLKNTSNSPALNP